MTNETIKALLMIALILGIEGILHSSRIENVWHRLTTLMPQRVSAKRKLR